MTKASIIGKLTHECSECGQKFEDNRDAQKNLTKQVQIHYRFRHKKTVSNPVFTLSSTNLNALGNSREYARRMGINREVRCNTGA